MKQNISIFDLAVTASVAIAANTFVSATGATAAAAGNALGVATFNAAIGQVVTCNVIGTATVIAGAAIAKGDAVEVGATGFAITKATGVTVGRALNATAAAGEFVEVLLIAN